MRKQHLLILVFLITFLLPFSDLSQDMRSFVPQAGGSSSILISQANEELEEQLIFGFMTDAPPISSIGSTGGVDGYCADLQQYLKSLGQFNVQSQEVGYEERFQAFESIVGEFNDSTRGVECGPHTKTSDREALLEAYGGKFSNTFFTTSTKVLIRKDKANQLFTDPSLISIGVVGGTPNITNISELGQNSDVNFEVGEAGDIADPLRA